MISLLILITSCTQVQIKDEQFCGDLGYQGAHCNNTLTDHPVDLNKSQWDILRYGWICEDADAFTDWKTIIQQLCDKHPSDCDYEALNSLFKKVEEITHE